MDSKESLNRMETKKKEVQELTNKQQMEVAFPKAPDGGWGWVVVFSSFMIHIIADGITYSFGIFYVEFLKYYGQSRAKTSWILSILVGITLGIGPISSALTNRFGCRKVTIAGAIMAAAGFLVSIYAHNVETLYLTIGLIVGSGFGFMYLPAIVSVSIYFEKKRAFATGIAVCGSGVGTFVMVPVMEYLVDYYSWKGALILVSAFVLNCLVFGALFRPLKATTSIVTTVDEMNSNDLQCNGHTVAKTTDNLDLAKNEDNPKVLVNRNVENVKRVSITTPDQIHLRVNGVKKNSPSELFNSLNSLSSSHHSHNLEPGPLHRKDILYSGSLLSLPQYKSNRSLYTTSMVSIPKSVGTKSNFATRHFLCSDEMSFALHEMLDLRILKEPVYLMFVVSNFLTSIGFNVPFVYTKDRALHDGIDSVMASMLIVVIGASNMAGRIVIGYISDLSYINRLYLYNVLLTICGIATIFSFLCDDFYSTAIYCSIFGITAGAYVGLTSVILADLLGIEKLTNAFGILLLFQGAASFIGPPIAGWLYDVTNSYDAGYQVTGTSIAISGLMLFFIPMVKRYSESKFEEVPVEEKNIPEIYCTAEENTPEKEQEMPMINCIEDKTSTGKQFPVEHSAEETL